MSICMYSMYTLYSVCVYTKDLTHFKTYLCKPLTFCGTSSEGFYNFGHGADSAEVPVEYAVLRSVEGGVFQRRAGQES